MQNRVTPYLREGDHERVTFALQHGEHSFLLRFTTEITRTEILALFMSMLKEVNSETADLPSDVRMDLSRRLSKLIDRYERRVKHS